MKTRARRWLFYGMTALLLSFSAEMIAQLGYYFAYGFRWHPDRLAAFGSIGPYGTAQIRALDMERPRTFMHPYLGRYTATKRTDPANFGSYAIADTPPLKYGADTISVVLLGGSVALQIGLEGKLVQALQAELATRGLRGRKVRLLVAAQSGGKQPVQLLAVLNLLMQGIRIDVAISLDGFNEINFGPSLNHRVKLNSTYPYSWFLLQRLRWGGFDPSVIGRRNALVADEHRLLFRSSRPFHHYSALVGFVLTHQVNNLSGQILAVQAKALASVGKWRPDELGPRVGLTPAQDVRASAAMWERTNRLVHGLARRHGFVFLPFLQPIQYAPGGKPLSPEERETAYSPGGKYGRAWNVGHGYPLLRSAGARMARDGIRFVDASGLFRDERRTVYSDECCHFNQRGIDALVAFIARHTAQALADRVGRSK